MSRLETQQYRAQLAAFYAAVMDVIHTGVLREVPEPQRLALLHELTNVNMALHGAPKGESDEKE